MTEIKARHNKGFSNKKYNQYKGLDVPDIRIADLPEMITVREAAAVMRISILTLKRMCKAKKIPYVRINSRGDHRFKKQDIINYIDSRTHDKTIDS